MAGGSRAEPGGGDLGEFTCGKRWGFVGVCVSNNVQSQFASLHGPLLSLKGSVAGSTVGLAPRQPATEPRAVCASGVKLSRKTF